MMYIYIFFFFFLENQTNPNTNHFDTTCIKESKTSEPYLFAFTYQ